QVRNVNGSADAELSHQGHLDLEIWLPAYEVLATPGVYTLMVSGWIFSAGVPETNHNRPNQLNCLGAWIALAALTIRRQKFLGRCESSECENELALEIGQRFTDGLFVGRHLMRE